MNLNKMRSHFPQLKSKVNDHEFIYFDNAATTLKPEFLADEISYLYKNEVANIHRGAHYYSNKGTSSYESTREKMAQYIGASNKNEIIFTKGTTESINLLANCLTEELNEGDEILLSLAEHHSNIVPWQIAGKRKNLKIKFLPIDEKHQIDSSELSRFISSKTKIISLTAVSNAIGVATDFNKIFQRAKEINNNILCVLDGAQLLSTEKPNLQNNKHLDFLAFSAHKIFGPFGLGILWGKEYLLKKLPPFQGGGAMIENVTTNGSTFLPPPHGFESGTPNIISVIAFKRVLSFLEDLDFTYVKNHEKVLLEKLETSLKQIADIKIYGSLKERTNILSFSIKNIHPSDIDQLLDQQGIAIRTGHLCAQPLMTELGVESIARISLSLYNTENEIEIFIKALNKSLELLR